MSTKIYQYTSIAITCSILLLLYVFVLLKIVKCKLFLKYADNFQHTGNITFMYAKCTLLHTSRHAICDVLITIIKIKITTIYSTL